MAFKLKYALSGKFAIAKSPLIRLALTPDILLLKVFCTVSSSFLNKILFNISKIVGIIVHAIKNVTIPPNLNIVK